MINHFLGSNIKQLSGSTQYKNLNPNLIYLTAGFN